MMQEFESALEVDEFLDLDATSPCADAFVTRRTHLVDELVGALVPDARGRPTSAKRSASCSTACDVVIAVQHRQRGRHRDRWAQRAELVRAAGEEPGARAGSGRVGPTGSSLPSFTPSSSSAMTDAIVGHRRLGHDELARRVEVEERARRVDERNPDFASRGCSCFTKSTSPAAAAPLHRRAPSRVAVHLGERRVGRLEIGREVLQEPVRAPGHRSGCARAGVLPCDEELQRARRSPHPSWSSCPPSAIE